MTGTLHTIASGPRAYARLAVQPFSIGPAAQRATRDLALRDGHAQELAALARWEGEGGAVRRLVVAVFKAPAGRLPRSAGFTGERNAGPPKRLRWGNAAARPMNTHRGQRSR